MSEMNSQVTFVDLFAGCGGLSLGLSRAGMQPLAAFELWAPAAHVYRLNFHHPMYDIDLRSDRALDLVSELRPTVLAGGPPCQDFSSAGKMRGVGERADLMNRFVDFVEAAEPKAVIMENVPRARLSAVFRSAVARLRARGYGLSELLMDAAYYGVPQYRERLFVVGLRGAEAGGLLPIVESRRAAEPLTIRQYFGEKLAFEHYFRVPTNYSRRGIFSADEPSMTVRAVDRPLPPGYPGHPDDSAEVSADVRSLNTRERARLQTFPEEFAFVGPKTHVNTMIGNAVPVNLAQAVGSSLLEYMNAAQSAVSGEVAVARD